MPESSQNANIRADLIKYAGFILSRKPYFSSQIRQKLLVRLKADQEEAGLEIIEDIIADLKQAKYLNDDYLLERYIDQKLQKLQGPKIIIQKLKMLNIPISQIHQALKNEETKKKIDDAEKRLIEKLSGLDQFKIRSKLYQRGF